jgi:N-acetylglucosaminyldiphosphoundecaprenol N-acetyl-beta-D-mannosaminyltransferase
MTTSSDQWATSDGGDVSRICGEQAARRSATDGGQGACAEVLGVRVDAVDLEAVLCRFEDALLGQDCQVVHLCNAYNVLLASKQERYREVMNAGDLNLPDGTATLLAARLLGAPMRGRVAGPDLLAAVCAWGVDRSVRHFFYGGTPESLEAMLAAARSAYPGIKIAGSYAPPFRPLSPEEADDICRKINGTGAQVVWVGLGTPKQDEWMEAFRHRIEANVLVGVGAAFDFLSGSRRRAPHWMQRAGLEWLHRLASEPWRLWRRYLLGNPEFVVRFAVSWRRNRTGWGE